MAWAVLCGTASLAWTDDLPEMLASASRVAAENVAESVIQIETVGGKEIVDNRIIGSAPTTGVIVSEDGHIISSAFNFVNDPKAILVTLATGKKLPAKIVARDKSRMLVMLKIEAPEPLSVPNWLTRTETQRGQWAVAMGRTYRGSLPSISVGIVSATNRIWGRAIQTDAKVSPVNYGGPLTDLSGNVIGILVPLSPEDRSESAGADLYDAGVGFAIPMEDVMQLLPQLQAGKDIRPGLLGISMEGRDIYQRGHPVIASCPARSPATDAGLEKGDQIVSINGQPINSQSQMKHVLGPVNAGETVELEVLRGQEQLEFSVTLVAEVPPYICPFLGVLPDSSLSPQNGVHVRHVYADSPADEAGIEVGDVLVQLDDEKLADTVSWRQKIAYFEPESAIRIGYERNGAMRSVDVVLTKYPEFEAEPSPADFARPDGDFEDEVETGTIEIKLTDEPNNCWVLVPENYDPRMPHAMVVEFHVPGEFDKEAFVQKWQAIAEQHALLVVAPIASDKKRWKKSEVAVVRKLIGRVENRFNIDPLRRITFGIQAGGAMAISFAFSERELVRGLAILDASIPRGIRTGVNDPLDRLELFFLGMKDSPRYARMELLGRTLKKRNFPVHSRSIDGPPADASADQLQELAVWIDALSRF